MRYTMIPLTLSLGLLIGCDLFGEDENTGPFCEDTVTELAIDQVSALEFSGQEILDLATASSPWAETLVYARDASETQLTLTVDASATTAARYVESVAVYPEGDMATAIGIECPSRVEVDVAIQVHTEDGAFDEALSVTLFAYAGTEGSFSAEVDPDALTGSYAMDDDITEDWNERKLWVQGSFDEAGSRGAIGGQISGEEDCEEGEACTAWAAMVEVGAWAPAGEEQ